MSVTSELATPASLSTLVTVSIQSWKSLALSSSNLALERVTLKSTSSTRLSTSILVVVPELRARLAFSQALLNLDIALLLLSKSAIFSAPCFSRIWVLHQLTTRLSKSSPPRWVSPPVALTSKTPPFMVKQVTSKVPPPRSKMTTLLLSVFSFPAFSSSALWRPYARAAAVGSLIMRRTLRPAMRPASLVAWRCWLLKWAGTVITADLTSFPRCFSAACLSSASTKEEISSGASCLVAPLHSTSTLGSPFPPSTTLKGKPLHSSLTTSSLKGRPMKRLTS
mmetsp:Transcript_2194/g.4489  ORF Transcript_2194/g.4489 Transcript_2194/m.4489 type:complete len:280 (+) Transcript_2194:886-1725(+)